MKRRAVQPFSEKNLILGYGFTSGRHLLVDVGAHHGSFSVSFARMGWEVIAFEPERRNRAAFERNLSGFPNVQCISKAVWDVSGLKVPFYVSGEHYGIHALRPFHPTHERAYEVETICLNDFLTESGEDRVTLLKIDTEGADFLALKGFAVERFRPEMIMVEFMDERSQTHYGYSHHDIVRDMHGFGYVAYVSEWAPIKEYGREGISSDPHTWLQCARYPLDHEPAWGNLLFVPGGAAIKFEKTLAAYLKENNVAGTLMAKIRALLGRA